MKKIANIFVSLALAFFGLGLISCADAIVDDGLNVRSYVNSAGGAGNSGDSGGAVPFKTYNDIFDMQIWGDYGAGCTTVNSSGALVITQTGTWYGVAICSNSAGNDSGDSYRIYDMSKVATIKFEAKSDTDGSILKFSACTEDGVEYTLSTEYQEFEYDMSKTAHAKTGTHYCMVSLVQNAATEGVIHYIKNIAFYDASGNEIVPTLNK